MKTQETIDQIKSENIVSEKVIAKTFKDAFKNGRVIRIHSGSIVNADNPAAWVKNEIPLSKMKHFRFYNDKG